MMIVVAPYTVVVDGGKGASFDDLAAAKVAADAASKLDPKARVVVTGALKDDGVSRTSFPAPCALDTFPPSKDTSGQNVLEWMTR